MTDDDDPDFDLWKDEDPIVRDAVEQAVAPWVGMLTPAALGVMRAAIADMLVLHPTTALLIRSLKEEPARQASGGRPVDGSESASETTAAKKIAGSRT